MEPPLDGRAWAVQSNTDNGTFVHIELVPDDQDANDPTDIITLLRSRCGPEPLHFLVESLQAALSQRAGLGKLDFSVRELTGSGSTLTWSIRDDLLKPDQTEVYRIHREHGFQFCLIYDRKHGLLTEQAIEEWASRLSSLKARVGDYAETKFQTSWTPDPAQLHTYGRCSSRPSTGRGWTGKSWKWRSTGPRVRSTPYTGPSASPLSRNSCGPKCRHHPPGVRTRKKL